MPTLNQVRNAVNSRLADLWTNQVQPRQATYFGNRGRYWQGIVTTNVDVLPANNDADVGVAEVTPDVSRKPTDQAESWSGASINLGSSIPMALQIDVFDGPNGRGYVGIVYARHNGNLYTRAQEAHEPGVTGEPWRTHDWVLVQEPETPARAGMR